MMVTRNRGPRGLRVLGREGALGIAVAATLLIGCGADPSDLAAPISSRPTASATTAAASTSTVTETDSTDSSVSTDSVSTTEFVPATTEPKIPIPPGVIVAVPQQNREDPAKGQFQVQVVNDTDERFEVVVGAVRVAGLHHTDEPPRHHDRGRTDHRPPRTVPRGSLRRRAIATMPTVDDVPSLDDAVVLLGLQDGTVREIPVIDRWHLARRLYLDDCRRQFIDASVTIEWADLHEEEFEGRPVTAGVLRLTRLTAADTITIVDVSGTVPYSFDAVGRQAGDPVIVLAVGDDVEEVPIRFTESRCDPHALAEVKQPHKFVAQVDLGDGVLQPYIVIPAESDWIPMRRTADAACVATGQVVFVGDSAP